MPQVWCSSSLTGSSNILVWYQIIQTSRTILLYPNITSHTTTVTSEAHTICYVQSTHYKIPLVVNVLLHVCVWIKTIHSVLLYNPFRDNTYIKIGNNIYFDCLNKHSQMMLHIKLIIHRKIFCNTLLHSDAYLRISIKHEQPMISLGTYVGCACVFIMFNVVLLSKNILY